MATYQKRINKNGEISYRIRAVNGKNKSGNSKQESITWKPNADMTPKQIEKELQKVEILEDELNHLKKLLLSDRISDDADVMITNSHVFIYELIHNCMERNDHYKDIRCINIDLHHDFVNGSEDVDCGNWISHLYKDYGDHFKFDWVVNPISREMFGLKEEIFDKTLLKSLADIKIKDFDVVFLCRSDNFFAPHLDPYFDEIVRLIESRFHDLRIEKSVNEVRDYRKYDSMYEKLHRSLKNS